MADYSAVLMKTMDRSQEMQQLGMMCTLMTQQQQASTTAMAQLMGQMQTHQQSVPQQQPQPIVNYSDIPDAPTAPCPAGFVWVWKGFSVGYVQEKA